MLTTQESFISRKSGIDAEDIPIVAAINEALQNELRDRFAEKLPHGQLRDDTNYFEIPITRQNGVYTISVKTPQNNPFQSQAIGEFFSGLREKTNCTTWRDMFSGKKNRGEKTGTFKATYDWSGHHRAEARTWADMIAGLNKALSSENKINTAILGIGKN